jgi:HAD superfamily hydrolase (TIGR01509 family)
MKIINRNPRTVLFDLDGVIIDSETVYLDKIYSEIIQRYKFLKKEDLYPVVGMDEERTRIFMHNIACEPLNNLAFDTYIQDIHINMQIDDYKHILNPGVIKTLEFLKKSNFKVALASSSKMHIIKEALHQCEIESFFDYVISGEQFKESKPNPEIYLTAIRAIGCIPEECIVVEDSSYGIEAGSLAGTYVIAMKDDRFNIDQSKADRQIETIDEIIDLLD